MKKNGPTVAAKWSRPRHQAGHVRVSLLRRSPRCAPAPSFHDERGGRSVASGRDTPWSPGLFAADRAGARRGALTSCSDRETAVDPFPSVSAGDGRATPICGPGPADRPSCRGKIRRPAQMRHLHPTSDRPRAGGERLSPRRASPGIGRHRQVRRPPARRRHEPLPSRRERRHVGRPAAARGTSVPCPAAAPTASGWSPARFAVSWGSSTMSNSSTRDRVAASGSVRAGPTTTSFHRGSVTLTLLDRGVELRDERVEIAVEPWLLAPQHGTDVHAVQRALLGRNPAPPSPAPSGGRRCRRRARRPSRPPADAAGRPAGRRPLPRVPPSKTVPFEPRNGRLSPTPDHAAVVGEEQDERVVRDAVVVEAVEESGRCRRPGPGSWRR